MTTCYWFLSLPTAYPLPCRATPHYPWLKCHPGGSHQPLKVALGTFVSISSAQLVFRHPAYQIFTLRFITVAELWL